MPFINFHFHSTDVLLGLVMEGRFSSADFEWSDSQYLRRRTTGGVKRRV